jgi:uncharacterized cupin superfamily protein
VTDFAVKNLMEIEDASSRPEVEARFSRKFLDSEHLGISHFRYAPGFRAVNGHRHEVQEEAYAVIGGSGGSGSKMRSSSCAAGTSSASPPASSAVSRAARRGSR